MNRKLLAAAILAAVSCGAHAQNTWSDWAPPVRSTTALPQLPGLPAPKLQYNPPTFAVDPPPRIVFDERGAYRPRPRDFDERDAHHRRARDSHDHDRRHGSSGWERDRYGEDVRRQRWEPMPAYPGIQPVAPVASPRPVESGNSAAAFQLPFPNPLPPNKPISGERAPMYNMLGMNHEHQVGAECVSQFGVSKAGAACVAGRLTMEELNKCFDQGVGGRGCFGDNNTLRKMVQDNFEAAKREKTVADQAIRATTGISVKDIKKYGPMGGPTSTPNKLCNAVAKVFGGKC